MKIRGVRLELSAIEEVLLSIPTIGNSAVFTVQPENSSETLLACVVTSAPTALITEEFVMKTLALHFPPAMLPHIVLLKDNLPLTNSGKTDFATLKREVASLSKPQFQSNMNENSDDLSRTAEYILEQSKAIFTNIHKTNELHTQLNFNDLGATSATIFQLYAKLAIRWPHIQIVDIFNYPSPIALASFLIGQPFSHTVYCPNPVEDTNQEIAIIGASFRGPGYAQNLESFWYNVILNGLECLTRSRNANGTICSCGILQNVEMFDCKFFRTSELEISKTDPQQRIFLETCYLALETSGYAPLPVQRESKISVFCGISPSSYLSRPVFTNTVDAMTLMLGNTSDFAASKVCYTLNLTGPAVSVNTACSSSLVAIHLAAQSLRFTQNVVSSYCRRRRECNVAVAGGVSIQFPQQLREGGLIFSTDGFCRPFAKNRSGTVLSNGAGVICMKPLSDAKRDNDHIFATILGTCINNDGHSKLGFTSPSSSGQEAVINSCIRSCVLGEDSRTLSTGDIDLFEAHATGTAVGDSGFSVYPKYFLYCS